MILVNFKLLNFVLLFPFIISPFLTLLAEKKKYPVKYQFFQT